VTSHNRWREHERANGETRRADSTRGSRGDAMRRKCEEVVVAERRRRRRRRKTSALSLHGIDDREERLHPAGLRHLPPRAHLRRGLPSLRRIGGWKTVTGFWNVPTRELDGRGVGAPSKRCAPPPSSRHPEGPAPGSLCRDMRGSPVRALRRGRNEAPHTSFRYETPR
jgi:hypothetical protein